MLSPQKMLVVFSITPSPNVLSRFFQMCPSSPGRANLPDASANVKCANCFWDAVVWLEI